jgi:cytochrome c peroxidase
LEDAIVHMAKAQLNRDLTKDQLRMLVAFLSSTTGPVPAAVR